MKTRRPLFAVALAFVVAVGGLMWGDNPAHAIVSVVSLGTTTIPYSGTVDGSPESVFLTGFVTVGLLVVKDPDFGTPPKLLMDIDLSTVTGTGLTSGATWVTAGNQNLVRPLKAADVVDVTFAIYPSNGGILAAHSALASLTLNFDVKTLRLMRRAASTAVNVTDSLAPVAVAP